MQDLIDEKCVSNHIVEKAVPEATKENSHLELLQEPIETQSEKINRLRALVKSGSYEICEAVIAEQIVDFV